MEDDVSERNIYYSITNDFIRGACLCFLEQLCVGMWGCISAKALWGVGESFMISLPSSKCFAEDVVAD